ncbi:MAG TPA: hypothetical protein VGI24_01775 [Solirubrobacteraceae bacterium]|jgi:hypothetical protein
MKRHVQRHIRVAIAASLACTCLILAAAAWAAQATQTLSVRASFTPDRLGTPTNLSASAVFGPAGPGPQSPAIKVTAYGPAGMLVDTRGAGVCTVTPAKLEATGPRACPASSRIGFGAGVGLFEIAHELLPGPLALEFFLAPSEHGHLAVLIYVSAVTPASEQLAFMGHEVRAHSPYGIGITFDIPIVPTLPGASLGWVQHVSLTFGAHGIAYYRTVHGRRRLQRVRGVVTPKSCPRGGFPIEVRVGFADGTATATTTTVPCPAR